MNDSSTRNIIAIIVVAGFVLTVSIIGIVPILGLGTTDVSIEFLKTYASIYSFIIGAIFGFYFRIASR